MTPDLARDLERHLAAIRTRDLAALKETLHPGEVILITADGELHRRTDEFLALHEDWFRSDTWSLATQAVHTAESAEMALAVLELEYSDVDGDGRLINERSYLTLVFRRGGDRWLLIQDQNTPVRHRG